MSVSSTAGTDRADNVAIDKIRNKCLSRGFSNLKCFSTAFLQFDQDSSHSLSFTEFQNGLQRYGVGITENEERKLFENFDKDNSGLVDFQEFFHKLTPPLQGKRLDIVTEVFHQLDSSGDGILQTMDLIDSFKDRAKQHPKYRSGEWTETEVVDSLLAAFEHPESRDGEVTLQEFIDYYSVVSSCVQDDAYFESHLKSCWGTK